MKNYIKLMGLIAVLAFSLANAAKMQMNLNTGNWHCIDEQGNILKDASDKPSPSGNCFTSSDPSRCNEAANLACANVNGIAK